MPDTDPDVLGRLRALRARADVPRVRRERRGRADGLRLAGPARGRPGLLRRHPRRPADQARAPRGPRRALPPARDRGVEPAERDHRGDRGRRSRPSSGSRSSPGMRHWQPRIADAVERALAGGADTIVGLVLAPHYSSMSIERYRAQLVERPSTAAPSSASSSAGATSPASSTLLADASARHGARTSSSPRTRCRRGSSPRATPTRTSCSRRLASSPSGPGSSDWSFAFQSESPTGEPWLGPGHPRRTWTRSPRTACARCSSHRSASSPTTSRSSGTSTSRLGRARAELGLELDRIELAERRPGVHPRARRARPAAAAVPSRSVKTGQIRRRGRSRAASVSTRTRRAA